MKNISTILSALAFVGVIVLFGMKFSGGEKATVNTSNEDKGGLTIAFVNIDSLEAQDVYLKAKMEDLEQRQEKMSAELRKSQQKLQDKYVAFQRKAQSGAFTSQAEAEAAEKQIYQMDQSLKTREASMTEELLKDQEKFQKGFQKRLDDFFAAYNKDHKYDYILPYSNSVKTILWADGAHDITNDVIEGLNKITEKEGTTEQKEK
ncbi:MAG: OmpH family outer membrane protein [Flavipsychrobacter sp.]